MEGTAAKLILADPDDRLVAAVLALGLRYGLVPLNAVSRWADQQILKLAGAPPAWLIELSLASEGLDILDVADVLKAQAGSVSDETIFRTFCSSLPDLKDLPTSECRRLAEKVYGVAYACFDGNWGHPLLYEADETADRFSWQADALYPWNDSDAVKLFRDFVDGLRDERLQRLASSILLRL